jgi:hypothetical protein
MIHGFEPFTTASTAGGALYAHSFDCAHGACTSQAVGKHRGGRTLAKVISHLIAAGVFFIPCASALIALIPAKASHLALLRAFTTEVSQPIRVLQKIIFRI